MSCPPAPPKTTCSAAGCVPNYSEPTRKFGCGKTCSGGGNNPNGPLDVPICGKCPGPKFPEDCPQNICALSLTARLVSSAVRLRNPNGSTVTEIFNYHNTTLCPTNPTTLSEANNAITKGIQTGVFRRTSTGTIKVYGSFGSLPSNLKLAEELGPFYQLCLGLFCDSPST